MSAWVVKLRRHLSRCGFSKKQNDIITRRRRNDIKKLSRVNKKNGISQN